MSNSVFENDIVSKYVFIINNKAYLENEYLNFINAYIKYYNADNSCDNIYDESDFYKLLTAAYFLIMKRKQLASKS